MKKILIIDDDIKTSSKYKTWLESELGFNSTLINDLQTVESNFKSNDYDLILIGFRMSTMDGFSIYDKLCKISNNVENKPKEFKICFMTSSVINHKVLAELHPELGQECYVSKEVPKDVFIERINSLISYYSYKKSFHFVMIGTVKGESQEDAMEILKTIMNKSEEIKEISELKIFGKTL